MHKTRPYSIHLAGLKLHEKLDKEGADMYVSRNIFAQYVFANVEQ